jgi:hypothetical protein
MIASNSEPRPGKRDEAERQAHRTSIRRCASWMRQLLAHDGFTSAWVTSVQGSVAVALGGGWFRWFAPQLLPQTHVDNTVPRSRSVNASCSLHR